MQRNARPVLRNPQRNVTYRNIAYRNAMQCKTSFEKSATKRTAWNRTTIQQIETSSISLRQAATTPADFALRKFHAMFFDKRKITCGTFRCGPVRCRFIRSTFWKRNSACGTLRCGTEFSRKDFVKREKNVALPTLRCITFLWKSCLRLRLNYAQCWPAAGHQASDQQPGSVAERVTICGTEFIRISVKLYQLQERKSDLLSLSHTWSPS